MNNKQSIMIGMAAAAILGATQAYAANGPSVNYSQSDVLLDLRDLTTPGIDMTIDVGNINTFADTAVGSTIEVVTPTLLNNEFGAFGGGNDGDVVGFTAAAETPGSAATLFLTRQTTGAGVVGSPSPQVGNNLPTANVIDGIGLGASTAEYGKGVASGANFATVDAGISKVTASSSGSYDSLADNGGGSTLINFGGTQPTSTPLEITANDGAQVTAQTSYASLWEVGNSGSGLDAYLGYFTFGSDGEVDYTGVNDVVAVPEPSTYGLLAATGLLAVALRRQLRSLNS